jgi:hypothetical protein
MNNAVDKELKEIDNRGIWEIIDEKNIPINHRCIKNKWIFKMKKWDFSSKTCGIWLQSSPRN